MIDIKMVVLDMAGTTVNEDNLVYKTVQKVINQEGFEITLEDVLKHGAGKEKHKAITDVLTACTDEKDIDTVADRVFVKFKVALEKAYNESDINAFEGMEAFFEQLRDRGVKIILNTGYDLKTANKLMNKLNWQVGIQVDALITSDDVVNGRPHPDMIKMAMAQFGINDPSHVLKAGDSEIDIIEGKNSGCGLTVGVLSGAQNREQLETAHPDYILQNVTELESILFR
ncbi:phosphonatase-like hydrolase [Flavobacterium cerinum]|uniref:Phosphonatase-like hydrolase n=1 Tax=Flavobacterium cerinum TaxID=2502784 RepID=A0A3S3TUX4_9FLAO|nr:phosphonatase-like hydrolase [Flavobacterium cerinum]RWW91753.1 phosphonatase-like hydrolase [Flavobacterium cerinum]